MHTHAKIFAVCVFHKQSRGCDMKNWLTAHFNVQKGMYFDTMYSEGEMLYFGSDSIEDSVWNYGTVGAISDESIFAFEEFSKRIGKAPNLYVCREDAKKHNAQLNKHGFYAPFDKDELVTETWMEFSEKKYSAPKHTDIKRAVCGKERQDFVDVFLAAYGGEKTPEKPYGDLPKEYTECLEKSFDNPKFYHFVCYCDGVAVSVATLCVHDGFGGLYNIGTRPEYERRGFGLAVTDAAINQWQSLCGKSLFLQTETGTGIDDWYERLGFVRVFDGAVYEKV